MTFPISNQIVRNWILESFPPAPCREGIISTIGSEPYVENDFDEFLSAAGLDIYEIGSDTDVLIVGRDFGHYETDEESFCVLLQMRKGKHLRVYSQEMFLAHWFSDCDPFEDEEVARAFAEGNPALELISTRWFDWISTNVGASIIGEGLFVEAPSTGILGYLGYTVAQKVNLSRSARRAVLAKAFNSTLPGVHSPDYMQEWGKPKSKERLKKMVDSMAWFCRSQKMKGNDIAASRYEEDLRWLKKTFYDGRFNFRWARSYVE